MDAIVCPLAQLLTLIAISVEQGGMADLSDIVFYEGGVLVMSIVVSGLLLVTYIFGGQRNIQTTYFVSFS